MYCKGKRLIALLIVLVFSIVSGCTPKSSEVANPVENQNTISEEPAADKEVAENTEPAAEAVPEEPLPENAPVVYMTKDISPEGLIRIYEALGRQASGKVGIKVHMGEPGGHNSI